MPEIRIFVRPETHSEIVKRFGDGESAEIEIGRLVEIGLFHHASHLEPGVKLRAAAALCQSQGPLEELDELSSDAVTWLFMASSMIFCLGMFLGFACGFGVWEHLDVIAAAWCKLSAALRTLL